MKYHSSVKILSLLLIAGLVSTGCSSYNVSKYSASIENINSMKSIKRKVNVGDFTAKVKGQSKIMCRGAGDVGFPNKMTFAQYIKDAFTSELKFAEKFDPKSKITINGYLNEVDFNSNIGTANWILKLEATSSNSKKIIINTKYEFEGSFVADRACSEVAQAFIPAVQKLINDTIKHKNFKNLI